MLRRLLCSAPAAAVAMLLLGSLAWAGMGQPSSGEMGMQGAATPVAESIHEFYNFVNIIIVAITVFVMLLLLYVMYRFNERSNPTPSSVTHNTALEVAWTVIPILVLVAIAIPSFRLLHLQYSYPKADLTLKATGYQWYWEHAYPELGISFETRMLDDASREELIAQKIDAPRNLAVDNEVIVPVNKVVNTLITAAPDGVIHDWTVPSFGSKVDAVPGRITSTWFKPTVEGVFYGQCSELCGKDHAFMPIAVRVVKEEVFNSWVDLQKQAIEIGKAASAEKDKAKRKELLKQKKDVLEKARGVIHEAALQQSGVRQFAKNESAAPAK
ncbi:cytochrome c oxidase subunit II [Hyphomicrobium sp. 1Nfss2.1]|uniref:cytochrome c oxidase subunit II n=1 Tax=Hyphomicrobium sp. 1Nfss2.1 TaxID=3413936 RepID=UPI003C7B2A97